MRWLLLLCPLIAYGQDLTTMTKVMNGVDDGTYHVNLGHSFPYYDKVFTDAWMSSNGVIILYDPTSNVGNPSTGNSFCCNGLDIASNPNPYYNYLIAPLWTDLTDRNPAPDAGYYYQTNSESSTFLWNKVYEYGTTNENTFGAELYKDGSFTFDYAKVKITQHSTFIGNTGELSVNPPQFTQQYFGQNLRTDDVQNFGSFATAVAATVDCSSPLNDPSCDGYYTALVPPPPVINATPPVVNAPLPVVNAPLPEPEAVIELVAEQRPEPPPRVERIPEVVQVAVQEVAPPLPEPEPAPPRPVERTIERTVDSPIDVQQYALALIATLTTPAAAPSAMSVPTTSFVTSQVTSMALQPIEIPIAEAFAVSTVATRSTSPVQIAESQEATPLLEQTTKQADVQFEADFNNAIGAGQSIGQFLSAQLPDMTRFDVKPPSQQEQRTTQRAEQAASSMSQEEIAESTEAQLEEMQESGGFSDQSLTVLLMARNADFNQYSGLQLQDNAQFYENRVIYSSNRPVDNSRALLLGPGTQIYREMVDAQWQR